jgi:hypothetical protein
VRYITETTSVAAGVVECWQLDLASFDSVKAFAKRGSPPWRKVVNGQPRDWDDLIS